MSTHLLHHETPHEALVEFVKENEVTLIVVATHGRSYGTGACFVGKRGGRPRFLTTQDGRVITPVKAQSEAPEK